MKRMNIKVQSDKGEPDGLVWIQLRNKPFVCAVGLFDGNKLMRDLDSPTFLIRKGKSNSRHGRSQEGKPNGQGS